MKETSTMAMSEIEREAVQERFLAIERKLNDIQVAINNLASKAQMKALLNIRQSEIEDLQTRVTTLESKVQVLEDS